jgi:hypothetical protein
MSMAPSDTSVAAARVQIDLLRKSGCERRAQLARSMSRTVIDLSRAALRDRMEGASEREVLLRWVSLQYGGDLADRVREYVRSRNE